jgi:putative nucleotidyltransferase with HDIG domain
MTRTTLGLSGFILLLSVTGAGALVLSYPVNLLEGEIRQALILVLAVALQLVRVDLFAYRATQRNTVSTGVAGTFLVLGVFGVEAAVWVSLMQALGSALITRNVWFKGLFNIGLYTTLTYLAGSLFLWLDGFAAELSLDSVVSFVAAAALYCLLQRACVSLVLSLSARRPFREVWSDNAGWNLLQQAVMALLGLLLGRFIQDGMTLIGALLLGSPLLLLHYSYKIFARRIEVYITEIERANLNLAGLNDELRATNDELIQTLGSVLDARDRYTYGHSTQVAIYSVALGKRLQLSPPELERLRQAALLHDIGKVGIPESILFKPGKLDQNEWRIMQAHAEIGYRITHQVHSLAHVADIIRQHHEWFGGGGYPRNLKGQEILLSARIIGVADALETLISDRPYRKGKPVEVAFQEIRRCAGTQFDPGVVGALEQIIRERGGLWFENSAAQVSHSALALEVAAAMDGGSQTR